MGLPLDRARHLLLTRAWRDVAGELIAQRAPALGVRRGVLEILVPDGSWGRVLREMVPRLACRLAAQHAELRVTRYRLVPDGKVVALVQEEASPAAPRARARRSLGAAAGPEAR
jgi:hypothetical protein